MVAQGQCANWRGVDYPLVRAFQLQLLVRAIAERCRIRVLAAAKVDRLFFGHREFRRREASTFVRTIAEWLVI